MVTLLNISRSIANATRHIFTERIRLIRSRADTVGQMPEALTIPVPGDVSRCRANAVRQVPASLHGTSLFD